MPLKKYIRDIQDFPKPGIGFKDITPLLIDPIARKETLTILLSELPNQKTKRYISEYGLPEFDSKILCSNFVLTKIFDEIVNTNKSIDKKIESSNTPHDVEDLRSIKVLLIAYLKKLLLLKENFANDK